MYQLKESSEPTRKGGLCVSGQNGTDISNRTHDSDLQIAL
jgi:hypothetical protein